MGQIKQVILCGLGGQGVVLAGTLLGQAAFEDGKWVSATNSYGAAARGGTCRAELVISDQQISFPHVIEADVLIAMSQIAYGKYVGEVKHEGGTVIYDERFVSPEDTDGLKHVGIPATKAAIEELNSQLVANVVILGAAVEMTKVVTREALKSAVTEIVPERLRDLDLKALDLGFELGAKSLEI